MLVKRRQVGGIISVGKDFAALQSVDENGFLYEISYNVNLLEAIKNNSLKVVLSIFKDRPKEDESLFSFPGAKNPEDVVSRIQKRSPSVKSSRRNQKSKAITKIVSDISSHLDNSTARHLGVRGTSKRSLLPQKTHIVLKSLSDLQKGNEEIINLQVQNKIEQNTRKKVQEASLSLILERGKDPSDIANISTGIITPREGMRGVLGREKTKELSPEESALLTGILEREKSDDQKFSDVSQVPVVEKERVSNVDILALVNLTIDDVGRLDSFFVLFELENSLGRVVFRTTKRVDHSRQVRIFNTPTQKPQVSLSPFRKVGQNILEVCQVDEIAQKVLLLRKTISPADPSLRESRYKIAGELLIKKEDGLKKFTDVTSNTQIVLYRLIPVGPGGEMGSIFKNLVAPPIAVQGRPTTRRILSVCLSPRTVEEGILLEVGEIPPGPIAISVVRKDLTNHESEFSFVDDGEPIKLVDEDTGVATFLDTSPKEDHVYEYACKLIFPDGDEEFSSTGRAIIEHISSVTNVVDTKVSVPEIIQDDNDIDISFNIVSSPIESELDVLKATLERQGLESLFDEDLKSERSSLQKVVTHGIVRMDMVSGEMEDLGTLSGESFVDSKLRKVRGAKDLVPGRRYRYLVSPQLRNPETLFRDLKITKQDSNTGKSYSFSPRKFLNPIALKKGTISTESSRISNSAKDDFALGRIGSTAIIEVSLEPLPPKIGFARAQKIDKSHARISWQLLGDADKIDHFLVISESLGSRSFVGAVHNLSQGDSFETFDILRQDEEKEVRYFIVPVLNDYSRGSQVETNRLVV